MRLFAFLGTGEYNECQYIFQRNGEDHWTSPTVSFVQTAVSLFLSSDTRGNRRNLNGVTIFATEKALNRNRKSLTAEFQNKRQLDILPEFCEIPPGMDQNEMISIFERLTSQLKVDDPLVFDMTHGFRSQPTLGMLILNYLDSLQPNQDVEDIFYGAYRENCSSCPAVSLKPLWDLNRWASEFRSFRSYGTVGGLADLANQIQDQKMRELQGNSPEEPYLKRFASALKDWERDIKLCALDNLYGADEDENGSIHSLHDELSRDWNRFTRNLGRFISPLKESLKGKISAVSAKTWHSPPGLLAQINLMDWLLNHGYYQQVLTLMREWMITFLGTLQDEKYRMESREQYTKIFNRLVNPTRDDHNQTSFEEKHRASELNGPFVSESVNVAGITSRITELRNGVNHCWIDNKNPQESIGPTIEEILEELRKCHSELIK